MPLQAAIVEGPYGPFGLLRLASKGPAGTAGPDLRRQITECFQRKHPGLPIVFVHPDSSGFQLADEQDVSEELRACLSGARSQEIRWSDFDMGP